jgi:hypothetical protein
VFALIHLILLLLCENPSQICTVSNIKTYLQFLLCLTHSSVYIIVTGAGIGRDVTRSRRASDDPTRQKNPWGIIKEEDIVSIAVIYLMQCG